MSNTKKTSFSIPPRRYLSEEVSRIIKNRIFDLEFKPGERLIVETLSQEIQVSMTPIREGLKELVSKGLVNYDGKSYSVFNPTPDEIMSILVIRRYLEQLATSLAAKKMSDEKIDKLISDLSTFATSNRTSRSSELIRLDQVFHRSILEGAGNERLLSMLETIQEQCWLIRHWGFAQSYNVNIAEATIADHLAIIQAIKDRKPEEAEALMKTHLMQSEGLTLEVLQSKQ